ncbi:MAG: hypothetical protein SPJ17_01605 [Anaeroplasma sp.]|uniref:hypothetical protein n=1 Tax=Anaeroplasma sp. TaxID=1872523 RepID=UPI002A90EDD1|nr:hypothetical protein [Anaeroplasma sp.]MDY5982385.1 hypothetical protein [Anaeroplasma sp.]
MKNKLFIFIMFIFSLFLFTSCNQRKNVIGSGEILEFDYQSASNIETIRISDIRIVNNTKILPIIVEIDSNMEKKITIYSQKEVYDSISITSSFGQLLISGNQNVNYVAKSIRIHISGYTLSNLYFELSSVKVSAAALQDDVAFNLNYATDVTLDYYKGTRFRANLGSNSSMVIEKLELSSLVNFNLKEKSTIESGEINAQEARVTLDNESEILFISKDIQNSFFTLNGNSIIRVSGNSNALDLVMSDGKYSGRENEIDHVVINIGYGKSEVLVQAISSIHVNSALGDCRVIYYGGDPMITKNDISGNVVIENGEI